MTPPLTAEQLELIREYHQPLYVWAVAGPLVGFATLGLVLRFGVRPLHAAAERLAGALAQRLSALRTAPVTRLVWRALDRMWRGPGWGTAMGFVVLFLLAMFVADLPAVVYFEYLHERAFGLSRDTPWTFTRDALKGMASSLVAFSALTFGLFGLARRTRHWWFLLGAVSAFALLFAGVLDPYRSQLYFKQRPLEPGPLRTQLAALLQRAQVEVKDIWVEETAETSARVQAYFAGQGPTRVIVLNDSLLSELTPPEVLAAVAHEAGHVHQPRWPGRIASSVTLLAFLYAVSRLLSWVAERGLFGISDRADVRALPLIVLVFGLAAFAFRPVAGAISRAREREADAFALALTRAPEAFSSMLVKATVVNKLDPSPPTWRVWLGLSHPPVSERLRHSAEWKQHAGEQTAPDPFPQPHP